MCSQYVNKASFEHTGGPWLQMCQDRQMYSLKQGFQVKFYKMLKNKDCTNLYIQKSHNSKYTIYEVQKCHKMNCTLFYSATQTTNKQLNVQNLKIYWIIDIWYIILLTQVFFWTSWRGENIVSFTWYFGRLFQHRQNHNLLSQTIYQLNFL